ncbi:MAG: phospho-sugar mutase [Bacteroidales bacterium]|jgi:phosphoglucomutase|nr:phospho-sugar mutase [Bacteroidales bacterium]
MKKDILKRAQVWLSGEYDQTTRMKVQDLIDNNLLELEDSFYRDLEFGTGGLRGIMGVGTNRINEYTIAMTTQGLANYLRQYFEGEEIAAAIAYDSRHNSELFSEVAANVLSANGIKVYLFDKLRPTPELSFAIRHFKCKTGIVITASHNPSEYNGYKVYWEDGGQIIAPHDKNIIAEVKKIKNIAHVKRTPCPELIQVIGAEVDKEYIFNIKQQSLSHEAIAKRRDMKIVYSPLHGTGTKLVPLALTDFGFANILLVEEQMQPDGAFPTVKSPNPEEKEALTMALEKAKKVDAELIMATDPDADRVGIAIKNLNGEFALIDGNQTSALLFYYMLNRWQESGKITGREFTVKTIVTSELLSKISDAFHVPCYETLTGFKYIADMIHRKEGKRQFIVGGEESYGYLPGDYVRDKDAVASCCILAEATAWAKEQGKSLYELLIEIYLQFGFYKERLYSLVRKGIKGEEEIAAVMEGYRRNPPKTINNSQVVKIKDYLSGQERDLINDATNSLEFAKSDVLQFFLKDGSMISVRPSGTEPKIKYYLSVAETLEDISDFHHKNKILEDRIDKIISSLEI